MFCDQYSLLCALQEEEGGEQLHCLDELLSFWAGGREVSAFPVPPGLAPFLAETEESATHSHSEALHLHVSTKI